MKSVSLSVYNLCLLYISQIILNNILHYYKFNVTVEHFSCVDEIEGFSFAIGSCCDVVFPIHLNIWNGITLRFP